MKKKKTGIKLKWKSFFFSSITVAVGRVIDGDHYWAISSYQFHLRFSCHDMPEISVVKDIYELP